MCPRKTQGRQCAVEIECAPSESGIKFTMKWKTAAVVYATAHRYVARLLNDSGQSAVDSWHLVPALSGASSARSSAELPTEVQPATAILNPLPQPSTSQSAFLHSDAVMASPWRSNSSLLMPAKAIWTPFRRCWSRSNLTTHIF